MIMPFVAYNRSGVECCEGVFEFRQLLSAATAVHSPTVMILRPLGDLRRRKASSRHRLREPRDRLELGEGEEMQTSAIGGSHSY